MVNVGTLSNALAVAIQQATDGGDTTVNSRSGSASVAHSIMSPVVLLPIQYLHNILYSFCKTVGLFINTE